MSSASTPAESEEFHALVHFLKDRYPAPPLPPVDGVDDDVPPTRGRGDDDDNDELDSLATRVAGAGPIWMKAAAIELIHWSDDVEALDAARRFMARATLNGPLLQHHRQLVDLSRRRLAQLCKYVCDWVSFVVTKLDGEDEPSTAALVQVDAVLEARVHALVVVMTLFPDGTQPELPLALAEMALLTPRWRRFDIRAAAMELLRHIDGAFPNFAHCPEVDASIKSLAEHPENFIVDPMHRGTLTRRERRDLHNMQTSLVSAILTQRAESEWTAAALGRVMRHPFLGDVVANAVHQFQTSSSMVVRLEAKRECTHQFLFTVVPRAAELSLTPAFAKKCGNQEVARILRPSHNELDLVVRLTDFTKGTKLAHVDKDSAQFNAMINRLVAAAATCIARAVAENWPLANLGNHPCVQLIKSVAGFASPDLMLRTLQPLLRVAPGEEGDALPPIERVAATVLLSQAAVEAAPRLLLRLDPTTAERAVRRLADPSQHMFYRSLGLRAAGSMAAVMAPALPVFFFEELHRQLSGPAPLGGPCVGVLEGGAEGLVGYGRCASLLTQTVLAAGGRQAASIDRVKQRDVVEMQKRDAMPWLVDLVIGLPKIIPPCITRNVFIEATANLTSRDVAFVPTLTQMEALLRRSEEAAEHTRQLDRAGAMSNSREERRLLEGLTTHINGDPVDLRKASRDAIDTLRAESVRVSEAETLVTFAAIFVSEEAFARVDHNTPAPIRKKLLLPPGLARRFSEIADSRARVLEALAKMICHRRLDDRERGFVRKLHMCTIAVDGFSRALDRHPELAQRIVPLALEALGDRFNVSQSHTVRAQGMRLLRTIARAIAVGPASPISCSLGLLVFDCIEELGYCLSFGGLPTDDPMSVVLAMSAVINHALIRASQRADGALAASLGADYLPPAKLRQHLWPLRRDVGRLMVLVIEVRRNDTLHIRSANVWMLERLRLFLLEMDRLEAAAAVASATWQPRKAAAKTKVRKNTKRAPPKTDNDASPSPQQQLVPPMTDAERRDLFPQHVTDAFLVANCSELVGHLPASPTTAMNLANFIHAATTIIPPSAGPTPIANVIRALLGGPPNAGILRAPPPIDYKSPARATGVLLLVQTALLRDPAGQTEQDLVAWHKACVDFLFGAQGRTGGGDEPLTANLAVIGAAISVLGLIAAAIEGGSVACRSFSWRPYAIAAKVCKRVFHSFVTPPRLDAPFDAAMPPLPALFRSPVDCSGRALRGPRPPRLPTDAIVYLPVASATASPDNPPPLDLAQTCVTQLRAIQRSCLTFIALVASEPCVPMEAVSAMEQDIMPTLAANPHGLARILSATDAMTPEQRAAVTPCSMATGVSEGTEAAAALFGGRDGRMRRQRLIAVTKDPSWLGANGAKAFAAELKAALDLTESTAKPKQRSR